MRSIVAPTRAAARQTRSLCYVTDLVEGLGLMMEAEKARGEVINLGNPEERTVLEIATLVRELVGSHSPFVFGPPAVGDDPRLRRPDISKARALLGWQPHTSIEAGLQAVIRELRMTLNGEVQAGRHPAKLHPPS